MKKLIVTLAAAWVAAFPLASTGQPAKAKPILLEVSSEADDTLGARLEYSLREKLRRSAGMTLVTKGKSVRIIVVTLPIDKGADSAMLLFSYTFTLYRGDDQPDLYHSTSIMRCGRNRIDDCASDVIAAADKVYFPESLFVSR